MPIDSKTSFPSSTSLPYCWKIGAPAGYGVMTVGMLMAKLSARLGLAVAGYAEYPSLIQGGHNTYELTVDHYSPAHTIATKREIDCLVCLTPETLSLHERRLAPNALVVFDPAVFQPENTGSARLIAIPLGELQAGLKADKIMINTIAFGASAALFGGSKENVLDIIADQFAGKKGDIAQINQDCAMAGFEYVLDNYADVIRPFNEASEAPAQLVMTGNDAFSLAAIAADCRFYVSYPMTPTSAVLEILAAFQEHTGMVVKTAEDEIAAIGSALGASFAGVRSSVGTSGGGFALMVEHISYAGVAEIPIVMLLGQRPGPATGMPTWTEQGDLLFAVHAGHGEFPKIVLGGGDIDEMAQITTEAFELADRYQTPVIVMTDKFLAESQRSVVKSVFDELTHFNPDRGKLETTTISGTYERYVDTNDGISPRLQPGTPGQYYQANSYEHIPDSHTTEDAAARIVQVDKRARKMETYLKTDWQMPIVYGSLDTARLVIVTWGSQKLPSLAAKTALENAGIPIAVIHFTHLYPLNRARLHELFTSVRAPMLLVENNSTGQLGKLLMQEAGIEVADKLLKYDGRPHFQEEIVAAVRKRVR